MTYTHSLIHISSKESIKSRLIHGYIIYIQTFKYISFSNPANVATFLIALVHIYSECMYYINLEPPVYVFMSQSGESSALQLYWNL